MTWIDVGGATIEAEAVQYVQDTRPQHGAGLARGMKTIVTLRNGSWFYARLGRSAILRRVKAATDAAPSAPEEGHDAAE